MEDFILPLWLLTSIVEGLGPDALLTGANDNVGVHLSESFGIAFQLGGKDMYF